MADGPFEVAKRFFSAPAPWWVDNMVAAIILAYDPDAEVDDAKP